jgi:AcrR family transcriptional regulator
VALADEGGLAAVTMRSVAAAIGTGPASLYRYVATRDELLELMTDEAAGEYQFVPPVPEEPVPGLLRLAHQARHIYRRHPWLIDLPSVGVLPGPNVIAYTEYVLAILDGTRLSRTARLEAVGIFTGVVRLLARTEADQRQAGQQLADWQSTLTGYLLGVVAGGRHPYLAAALTGSATGPPPAPAPPDDLFDRTLTRILTGLLTPQLSRG